MFVKKIAPVFVLAGSLFASPAFATGSSAPPTISVSETSGDRVVRGADLRIEAGESVGSVTVLGGDLEVEGAVTGDVTVVGGSVHVHPGGRVQGNVKTVGGELHIDEGGTIGGDVVTVGGGVSRGEGARSDKDTATAIAPATAAHSAPLGFLSRAAEHTKNRFEALLALFVLGTVFIALATQRMERLKAEVALRPLRTLGIGAFTLVAGLCAAAVLCLTIVGIPFAMLGLFLALIAGYAGVAAVLSTVGEALVGHRTKSPYA